MIDERLLNIKHNDMPKDLALALQNMEDSQYLLMMPNQPASALGVVEAPSMAQIEADSALTYPQLEQRRTTAPRTTGIDRQALASHDDMSVHDMGASSVLHDLI